MKQPEWEGWIKYSTLGIEMAVIIGISVWGGVAIDRHRQATFPLFTLLLAALGLTVAMIRLVKGIKH
ncbi:MAG: AtpZ/AtpI family protein [Bacteroidales bacterium]|nr:AtpZ/AtpI family protein [Bacteroidales bacterium]